MKVLEDSMKDMRSNKKCTCKLYFHEVQSYVIYNVTRDVGVDYTKDWDENGKAPRKWMNDFRKKKTRA